MVRYWWEPSQRFERQEGGVTPKLKVSKVEKSPSPAALSNYKWSKAWAIVSSQG